MAMERSKEEVGTRMVSVMDELRRHKRELRRRDETITLLQREQSELVAAQKIREHSRPEQAVELCSATAAKPTQQKSRSCELTEQKQLDLKEELAKRKPNAVKTPTTTLGEEGIPISRNRRPASTKSRSRASLPASLSKGVGGVDAAPGSHRNDVAALDPRIRSGSMTQQKTSVFEAFLQGCQQKLWTDMDNLDIDVSVYISIISNVKGCC